MFSGGSTTCNFIQFSFLLIAAVRRRRRRHHNTRSTHSFDWPKHQQSKSINFLFCVYLMWLKQIHTLGHDPDTKVNERIEFATRPLLWHANMCTICFTAPRQHKRPQQQQKTCEFYSQLIRLVFVLRKYSAQCAHWLWLRDTHRDPFENVHRIRSPRVMQNVLSKTQLHARLVEPGSLRIRYLLS